MGTRVRAEAFAANKKVATKKWNGREHGTAGKNHTSISRNWRSPRAVPVVSGTAQVAPGQPTASCHHAECYPYRDMQDNTLQYK